MFLLIINLPKDETKNLWIPEGSRWIVSTRETPAYPVIRNTAKTADKANSSYQSTVYFCGVIPIKNVSVSVTDDITVIPGGEVIGINLKPGGAYIAKTETVELQSGKSISPGESAGLKKGDIIENHPFQDGFYYTCRKAAKGLPPGYGCPRIGNDRFPNNMSV